MATWSNTITLGVIAEDKSDVEVLYELTCKVVDERKFSLRNFAGGGCGTLRRKCEAWAENLLRRGCDHLVIVHDCDQNDEAKLRRELGKLVNGFPFRDHLILIPVRAIEAWLLADMSAVKRALGLSRTPKTLSQPEDVLRPKEKLRDIAWNTDRRRYVNTIHNKKIAALASLTKLGVCPSFRPYPEFLKGLCGG